MIIYRMPAYNSIMSGYFWIGFNDFILKNNSLLKHSNSFSPSDYENNDEIILKYFQSLKGWKNYIALFAVSIVLISKALIDSNISHDKFILINNLLKEIYDMKK